jgi:hypothetical protein
MFMNIEIQGNCNKGKDSLLHKLARFVWTNGASRTAGKLTDEEIEIVDDIWNAYEELQDANRKFELAENADIVDYYTYKIKASETRYNYLIKKAKEKGVKQETFRYMET